MERRPILPVTAYAVITEQVSSTKQEPNWMPLTEVRGGSCFVERTCPIINGEMEYGISTGPPALVFYEQIYNV